MLGVATIPGITVFLREIEARFEGDIKDLRPEVPNIPHLVGEKDVGAYDTCNAIATEARGAGLAALLAPSARHAGGSCLPVFARPALSIPTLRGWVAFRHDQATGNVVSNELP